MPEVTHTSGAIYGLRKAVGKGFRLWAGKISITDGYTLDTGLDTIEGMSGLMVDDAAVDNATPIVAVSGVSAGTLTFVVGKIDDHAHVVTPGWLMVVGVVR